MNKKELLRALSQKTGMTNQDAKKAVEAFTEIMSDTLVSGGKIQLVGFGSFETLSRGARTVRNPRTGEVIKIKSAKVPKDAVKR